MIALLTPVPASAWIGSRQVAPPSVERAIPLRLEKHGGRGESGGRTEESPTATRTPGAACRSTSQPTSGKVAVSQVAPLSVDFTTREPAVA